MTEKSKKVIGVCSNCGQKMTACIAHVFVSTGVCKERRIHHS